MKKKISPKKGLSSEIKLWWLFNSTLLIQAAIYFINQQYGSLSINNPIIHFFYNVTSIFIGIPYILIYFFAIALFGFSGIQELLEHFRSDRMLSSLTVALAIFLSIAMNYVYAKILTSSKVVAFYKSHIKQHPVILSIIILIILYLFAKG